MNNLNASPNERAQRVILGSGRRGGPGNGVLAVANFAVGQSREGKFILARRQKPGPPRRPLPSKETSTKDTYVARR